MKLTTEQKNFVNCPESALLVACPGSGKTRVIVAKLLKCLEEIRGSSRRIACITYTTAAVHEIDSRLRQAGNDLDYCEVCTIHSFCLNNILCNFYWMIPEYKKGFNVAPPDSDVYNDIVNELIGEFGLSQQTREGFQQLNRLPDGTPVTPATLTPNIAKEFWRRLLKKGLIDFSNIVYFSYQILLENPFIAKALSSRFSWILVDEFQDTSALQVEILTLIAAKPTNIKLALVGDPYQSIYGFAGARPKLMYELASRIKARQDFSLTGNYRSTDKIIAHAERLFTRNPPMKAKRKFEVAEKEPIYTRSDTAFQAITDYFLPAVEAHNISYGDTAVLAPNWFKLLHLGRQLREYGVPIVGPGARPYKRTHLFAQIAEQLCAYAEEATPDKIRPIERELFNLLLNVTGANQYGLFTYDGRRTVIKLLHSAIRLKNSYQSAVKWLREASAEFGDILEKEGHIGHSQSAMLRQSVEGMIRDMERNHIDLSNLVLSDLGMFANPASSMKLLTIHASKGREFEAVAVIDLHEGQLPHWSATTLEAIEGTKRQFYVAVTRAKQLLFYVTDNENKKNIPSRFLGQAGLGLI